MSKEKKGRTGVAASIALALASLATTVQAAPDRAGEIARGRYVVVLGGCNDCHTEAYAPQAGKVPERDWLLGSRLGYQGPWGTTYATNLRRYMQGLTADQWVQRARTIETRPPMPWFTLHALKESDLRAMHAYVRSLGPVGEPAPAFLPPGQEAKGPVVRFP